MADDSVHDKLDHALQLLRAIRTELDLEAPDKAGRAYTIEITHLIASARRFNRIRFDVLQADGSRLEVVYPRNRNGEDDNSLAVEDSVFSLAQWLFTSGNRRAVAELYLGKEQPPGKIAVEGIRTLQPST